VRKDRRGGRRRGRKGGRRIREETEGEERGKGRESKGREGEISPPWSFLKVGAYGAVYD